MLDRLLFYVVLNGQEIECHYLVALRTVAYIFIKQRCIERNIFY